MIESSEIDGELPTSNEEVTDESLPIDRSIREKRIRGAFRQGAEHLMKQEARGIDSGERAQRMIKFMVALLILGFVLWYFVFR